VEQNLTAAAVVAALEDAQDDRELANVRKRVRPEEPAIGVRMGHLFAIAKTHQRLPLDEIETLLAHPAAGHWRTSVPARGRRPEIIGNGRLPMSTMLARPRTLDLDGSWRFLLRGRPEDVDRDDLTGDTSGWTSVTVPGCWTMQGHDRPHYTNFQMPFPGPPPAGARPQPHRRAPPHR
jgi:hypothetical protein